MQNPKTLLTFITMLFTLNLTAALWSQSRNPAGSRAPRKELTGKRSPQGKTFDNGNGTYTAEIGIGHTHYRNARGELLETDLSFRPSADPDRSFQVTRGLYQVFFDKSTVATPFTTFRTQSGAEIRFRLDAMAYYDRSTKNHVVLSQAADGEPSDNGNRMTFSEVFPGVDVRYEYTGTRLKEEILFSQSARQNLPDPTSLGFRNDNVYLAFLTRFEVDSTFEVFSKNVKLGKRRGFDHEGEDRVDFKNPGGKTTFFLPLDFAYFDRGAQTDSTARRYESKKVLKRLFSTEAGDFLFAAIPLKWLQKLPAGPVVIDPTIAVQPDASLGEENWIYKSGGGNDNYGASGGWQVAPDRTTWERRALIKFNIDDVPSNATIVSADLRLYAYTTWGTVSSFTAEAHKMLVAWDEGTGSAWNNNLTTGSDWQYADEPGSSWGANGMQSGTDYSATVISTTEMNSTDTNKWKTVDVKSAVEDWLATPSSNHGVALITESADISDYIGIGFRSSDYTTDPTLRPKLVVTYTFGDLAEYNYTPSGAINSVTYNSGDSTYSGVFAYQEREWVTDITYKSESDVTLFEIDYIHDDIGNIDSLSYTNLAETDNVGYDYDNLNRLTKATSNTHNELIWTYDKNGNIKTKQVTDTQTNYAYTYDTANGRPNRLTDFDGASYGYDANGNVGSLEDDGILLQRDYKGRIEWYEGVKDEYYDYDANGMRVYKLAIEDTTYIENFDDGDFDDGLPTDWYTSGANWEVSSSELFRNSTTSSLHQFSNPDITYDDFTVEYDLKADAYASTVYWAAFAFRKTNYTDIYPNSGYMVYYRYNGEILLYEAGVGNLASDTTGLDLSTWRHVKIVTSGSSIKVYVDGTLRINTTDATYTGGYFGYYVSGLKARFDNLEIRDEAKVHYVRDANGDVLAEYNDGGDLLAEYVYANGQRISKLTPSGGADIYLNDHLGSARVMARSGWSANYYPFGEVASQTGSNVDTRFDFTGQERDEGTGFMYFGARFYEPVIGRFLSVDPRGDQSPGLTSYHYTRNNPLVYVDPDGEKEYKVTTRTFIPYASIIGFRGDNRGPTTAENASSRTSHSVRVETNPAISSQPLLSEDGGKVSRTNTTIGGLSAQGKGIFTTGVTRTDANNGNNAVISVTGTATNPFDKTGKFSIDYDFQITLTPGENGVPNAKITGSHDGFPAYEINVTNEAGQTFQIYYNGVESKWQVRELLPPKDEKVEDER